MDEESIEFLDNMGWGLINGRMEEDWGKLDWQKQANRDGIKCLNAASLIRIAAALEKLAEGKS
jgi:hypothetical protein